jgi:hypothetical protein
MKSWRLKMAKREVMQLALDALQYDWSHDYIQEVVEKLRAELAKPEPESVAWIRPSEEGYDSAFRDNSTVVECAENKWEGWFPLYRKEDVL